MRSGHSGIVRDWVLKGEVVFGIILKRDRDPHDFKIHEILQGKYGIYKAKMPNKAILNKLIISEESHEDKLIIKHLKEPPPILEVLSWEVIANIIQKGLGMGILPDYVARRHALVRTSIKVPSIPYSIVAISSTRKALSRNSQMFIDLMQRTSQ